MAQIPRIRFDATSDIPAIRQIADGLRVLFVDRQLKPGTALPSVRRMAIELGVHFNTVAEAYRQLATEGWLELKHGKAAVVLERAAPILENPVRTEEFRNRLQSIVARMRSEGVSADSIAAELRAIAKAVKGT